MIRLPLDALEGTHPLAFMAALGVLRLVTEHGVRARLGFPQGPAVLESPLDAPALVDLLGKLIAARLPAPELALDDLKHPLEEWGRGLSWGRELALSGTDGRRTASCLAAFASDLATTNDGVTTKPTAFHMTAGQQKFTASIRDLTVGLAKAAVPPKKVKRGHLATPALPGELTEALFGPWRYSDAAHPLGWDPWAERLYAYQAVAPTKAKGGISTRAAVWLASEALPLFPVFAQAGRWRAHLATTGVSGRKPTAFVWPVWSPFAALHTVRTLIAAREVAEAARETGRTSRRALAERGVRLVCSSVRADLGTKGYAIFRPPTILPLRGAG